MEHSNKVDLQALIKRAAKQACKYGFDPLTSVVISDSALTQIHGSSYAGHSIAHEKYEMFLTSKIRSFYALSGFYFTS